MNNLIKIKKNAKMCKKVLHLYVPFFADSSFYTFIIFIVIVFLNLTSYWTCFRFSGRTDKNDAIGIVLQQQDFKQTLFYLNLIKISKPVVVKTLKNQPKMAFFVNYT